MKTLTCDVLIVGGGLAGLTLAYELSKKELDFHIVEASDVLGGRIRTIRPRGIHSHVELGATWFGPTHTHLRSLINELSLQVYEQSQKGKALFQSMSFVKPQVFDIPQGQDPSFRLVNGSSSLIQSLSDRIGHRRTSYNFKVSRIALDHEIYIVTSEHSNEVIKAKNVVITTPPQIAAKSIILPKELPTAIVELMNLTHTWMNDSIKFALISSDSWWQKMGFSGTFFSQVGPVVEMYDHSNYEGTFFALKGFLNASVRGLTFEQRAQKVRKQLAAILPFFENEKFEYVDYHWYENPLVHIKNAQPLYPHQNNGHQQLRNALINNSLWLGGTETAKTHPGYMDGAVERAKELAEIFN